MTARPKRCIVAYDHLSICILSVHKCQLPLGGRIEFCVASPDWPSVSLRDHTPTSFDTMSTPRPAALHSAKCSLEPINLHDPEQVAELLRQRVICGWDRRPEVIARWRDETDAGLKAPFWIQPPPPPPPPSSAATSASPNVRIGHISLDSTASPPDLSLANPHDKSVLAITNLFVLPEHRRGGIARAAVDVLTSLAKTEPYGSRTCTAVAVTAISKRYHDEDEWRARYEWLSGMAAPERGRANEDWYVRMGFVKWKEEPRYDAEVPGREGEKFVASFLRKEIG